MFFKATIINDMRTNKTTKYILKGVILFGISIFLLTPVKPAFAFNEVNSFTAPSFPSSNVLDLFNTGYSLSSFDIGSGNIMGDSVLSDMSSDYSMISLLTDQNVMAVDNARMARQAAEEAEKRKKEEETKKAAALNGNQTEVGPDGCPTNAPANTLRSGADKVGISDICARSVAGARTAEAALAIKYTLTHLGYAYSQPRRNSDAAFDCSSYVSRAYQAAGLNTAPPGQNAPIVTGIIAARWTVKINFNDRMPGDLVAYDWDGAAPHGDHVVMALVDNWMVHTNKTGDVSHVTKIISSAYWTGYVDPSKAR